MKKQKKEELEAEIIHHNSIIEHMKASILEDEAKMNLNMERIAYSKSSIEGYKQKITSIKWYLENKSGYLLTIEKGIDGNLSILYWVNGVKKLIGFIDYSGKMCILSIHEFVINYKAWREHGCKVDEKISVEWGGREKRTYSLFDDCLYTSFNDREEVLFNFEKCIPPSGVSDKNIQRFTHNRRPIMF